MKPDDPSYWMLKEGPVTLPNPNIYRENCYICRDPEFQLMGLPLCYPCSQCGGHVPADDTFCDDCGYDQE